MSALKRVTRAFVVLARVGAKMYWDVVETVKEGKKDITNASVE